MEPLEGRTALVTGASRGIGRACALALARAGCPVAVNYRSRDAEAEETCALIAGLGGQALPFRADVSRSGEVRGLVEAVRSRLGPVSILVNNAGVARKRAPLEITEEDWDEAMTVNLKSAFLASREVLPGMREMRWGRIVNVSSNAAYTTGIVGPHYVASKAGMLGLSRAYAMAFAREGITVNAVAPGAIETEMLMKDLGVTAARSPVGRFGTSEEVADAVMMLVRNGYITGQTLIISGGSNLT
ncbi:MAG: SDR family oxidoreductase [Candidatus Tectomicrobia bacterium]|uniref:SDR family oxidoreductase n=1 Tax=Tectimicrobiota bacterium TaxID=2528274 RepID=A0A932MQ27_UNCTE|nr:SDR family oxidoreductase [Candidatus Tectomicrobia bacterium]